MHYTTEQLVSQAIALIVKLTSTPICPEELLNRVSKEYGETIARLAIQAGFENEYIVFSPGTTVQLNNPDAGKEADEAPAAEPTETDEPDAPSMADILEAIAMILTPPKASTSAAAPNPFEELLDAIFGGDREKLTTNNVLRNDKVRIKPGIPSEISSTRIGTVIDTFETRALVLFADGAEEGNGLTVAEFDQLVVISRA